MIYSRPEVIHCCSANQDWPNSACLHIIQQNSKSATLNRTQQKDSSHD